TLHSGGGNMSFAGSTERPFGLSVVPAARLVSLHDVGATTPLTQLVVDPAGIVLNGSIYHTTGSQTYSSDVTLGSNVSLTSDTGNIEFQATASPAPTPSPRTPCSVTSDLQMPP